MNGASFYFQYKHSDAWAKSQYPTLKILIHENLAEVFSPNFMCVQTHLCSSVLLYLYPIHEDVKIIFHSLLWFMSAFKFLFFLPSPNSAPQCRRY